MQENWVDFKAVKAIVTMEMVLGHYQVNWLRKNGNELRGRCPIHQGEGASAFHVNTTKNAFHCFSCKAKGNVLDFVAAMEKCSVREAARRLADCFALGGSTPEPQAAREPRAAHKETGERGVEENKPLTFQLKGIDHEHPYLKARGITTETAQTFGVGYFPGHGSMQGRIVIPIHNERGELVAYAGRSIDDSEPRYKLPAGFHKSQVLYNLHRVTAAEVIIVEGFFDCMKVHFAGFPQVVALMGSSLSERQEDLLVNRFKKVTLLLDGDEAGVKAAETLASRFVRKVHIRILEVPNGQQPDQLRESKLNELCRS